jgi:hypothetical protein
MNKKGRTSPDVKAAHGESAAKDVNYFKEFQRRDRALWLWAHTTFPQRFADKSKQNKTTCDNKDCNELSGYHDAKLFLSPIPVAPYKFVTPFIYCEKCLKFHYQQLVGTGMYDIHERYLDGKIIS